MNDISVAFSGSGFKVPGHVGALRAIEASGKKIVEVSGTSGGSIIAAMYACGMTTDELYEISMHKDWSDLMEMNFSALFKGSYCNGNNLYNTLLEFTKGKTFADVDMPLKIVTSDVSYNQPFVFSQETTPDAKIALAVRASASIPFVYTPVKYEGQFLVDGGLVNNIPVDRLTADNERIGIQMHTAHIPFDSPSNLKWPWNLAGRLVNLMISSNENTHISTGHKEGASMVYVETGFAEGLDTNMSFTTRRRLYDNGFIATKSTLDDLNCGCD